MLDDCYIDASELVGMRLEFRATVGRTSIKLNEDRTVIIHDIRVTDTNEQVMDHIWLNWSKPFTQLNIQENDIIVFEATIKKFTKGYRGIRRLWHIRRDSSLRSGYRLSRIRRMKVIGRQYSTEH